MIRFVRRYLACRKLQRMVSQNASSFRVQDYRKRREAAKKGRAAVSGSRPTGQAPAGLVASRFDPGR
jgi:hypothetical protein